MANYRKIYEEYHGVTLTPDIDIHHIDGDRMNNAPENLEALTREEHIQRHLDQGEFGAANLLSKGKVDVSGDRNPMYGVEPWNKGKKLHYEVWNKGKAGYKNKYPSGTTRTVTEDMKKQRSEYMKKVWEERRKAGIKINHSKSGGCAGYKWYNNGITEMCTNEPPTGTDWIRGRLKGIKRGDKRK